MKRKNCETYLSNLKNNITFNPVYLNEYSTAQKRVREIADEVLCKDAEYKVQKMLETSKNDMNLLWKVKHSLKPIRKEDLVAVRNSKNERIYNENETKIAYEEYFKELFTHNTVEPEATKWAETIEHQLPKFLKNRDFEEIELNKPLIENRPKKSKRYLNI